jgi:hypothetical protein
MLLPMLAFALTSVLGMADVAADAGGGSSAMVRVDVTDHDSGKRVRRSTAVAWSSTASFELDVGGHAFVVGVVPLRTASGASIDLDMTRDAAVLASDLHVDSADRRFEVTHDNATVVVTVVPVKTTISAD